MTRLTVFSSSDPASPTSRRTGWSSSSGRAKSPILCRYLEEMISVRLTYLEPREGFVWPNPPETNYVDTHTFAKLKQMSIAPSDLCTDYEFVRRAYLDCIGRMPTTDGGEGVPRRQGREEARQADRHARRACPSSPTSGRSSGPTCSAVEPQDDPGEGQLRLPGVAPRPVPAEHAVGQGGAGTHHRQRQHLHEPARELLPHRQGPARASPRRPRSCSSACGCSAPSATTTRSSGGARTTTTAWPRGSPG